MFVLEQQFWGKDTGTPNKHRVKMKDMKSQFAIVASFLQIQHGI